MKKIYFFTAMLICSLSHGQFSENFDAGPTLPGFWTSFIGVDGLGTAQNWGISTTRSYSGTNSAFVRYEAGTGGVNEDWLVTSLIDLTGYSGCTLTFYGGQQYTTDYGTTYQVKISTTSQDDIATFTDLVTYGEADFTDITTLPLTSLKTVDLTAYDGQQIYIAFVMIQDDGDNWFIDDVNVTGTLATADFENAAQTRMYPNPTNGIVNIESAETVAICQVYGLSGNLIKSYKNVSSIDVSSLNSGTYMVKLILGNGKTSLQKLIKK